ncbi:four-carbon acid sugar kinase family protein, partial [Desulfosarcina sp.]|uniref:four-carbon acid sugar kinase family protein n=1 Tax=Desulfosarcina sp. TaxID=2027861 RepID=UPI003561F799
MNRVLQIAVIADDITGAADTGVQFCPVVGPIHMASAAEGAFTTVIQSAGLALFTDTRNVDAATATARVRATGEIVCSLAPRRVYKKIDSCLRGNVGAEIDALLQTTNAAASFVAPALPQQGRTTVNGVHRVYGVPVAETEIGRDPLCPVRESRLPVLLSTQSQMPVGHVDLACIEEGSASMAERVHRLMRQGCRLLTFDAVHTAHLDAVANLAREHVERILLVGSAGLAGSLARIMARDLPSLAAADRPSIAKWLFVCGSSSRVLADQVAMLTRSASWACQMLDPFVLTSSEGSSQQVLHSAGLVDAWSSGSLILCLKPIIDAGSTVRPDRVVRGLAKAAAALITAEVPEGLFLSGG